MTHFFPELQIVAGGELLGFREEGKSNQWEQSDTSSEGVTEDSGDALRFSTVFLNTTLIRRRLSLSWLEFLHSRLVPASTEDWVAALFYTDASIHVGSYNRALKQKTAESEFCLFRNG